MSKIIGVTVGTTLNPAKIADNLKPVKTVNGIVPDENGNVSVNGKDGYTPIKGVDYFDGKDGVDGKDGTNIALCSYAIGTLPKGRAKGDVNGDGVLDSADVEAIQNHSVGYVITGEVNLWAADVDNDGYIDSYEASIVNKYQTGQGDYFKYAKDYYGNWQFDKTNQYYYFDIAVEDMTADCGCVVVPAVTFKKGSFVAAIPMDGAIRFCFKACPTEDILCRILYSPELEGVSVGAGVKKSFLDSTGGGSSEPGAPGVGIATISIEEVVAKLISFTISKGPGFDVVTYQAEEGMTWGQWVESEYNPGWYVVGYDKYEDIYGIYNGDPSNSCYLEWGEEEGMLTSDDVIVAGHEYFEWV